VSSLTDFRVSGCQLIQPGYWSLNLRENISCSLCILCFEIMMILLGGFLTIVWSNKLPSKVWSYTFLQKGSPVNDHGFVVESRIVRASSVPPRAAPCGVLLSVEKDAFPGHRWVPLQPRRRNDPRGHVVVTGNANVHGCSLP
jgi:hypothetical protein